MRGIFGWSLPPGAAGDPSAPWNQVEQPCDVCGKAVDWCICPECATCGQMGAPECYEAHGLNRNAEQLAGLAELEAAYQAQADADEAEYRAWRESKNLGPDEES